MKLNQCDSCGKQAPQVDIGVMHPTSDGADGWVTLNIHVYRKTNPPPYMVKDGTYYTNLISQLDLCPECAARTFVATGCREKITTNPPPHFEPSAICQKCNVRLFTPPQTVCAVCNGDDPGAVRRDHKSGSSA